MNCVDTFKCIRMKKTFTVGRCIRNQKDALEFWGPDAGKFQSCPCDQGIEIRQQVEGIMSVRGICKNCEREMAITQEGLCGGCYGRIKGLQGEAREKALANARRDFKGKAALGPGNRKPREKVSTPVSTRKPEPEPAAQTVFKVSALDHHSFAEELARNSDKIVGIINKAYSKAGVRSPLHVSGRNAPGEDFSILRHDDSVLPPAPVILSVIVNFTDGDSAIFEGLQALARKYRRNPDQQILWLLEKELLNESLLNTEKAVDHAA